MANIKFSQFTSQTDYSNVDALVGYNGATNVRISPSDVINSWNGEQALIRLSNNVPGGTTSLVSIGQSPNTTTTVDLLGSDSSYDIRNLNAIRYNGSAWGIADNNIEVDTISVGGKVISYIPYFQIGNGAASTVQLLASCDPGGNFELTVNSDQVLNVSPGSDLIIGPGDEITIFPTNGISIASKIQFNDNVLDTNGASGLNDSMLVSLPGAGSGVFWKNPAENQWIGYKSFQLFKWSNGSPVSYANWGSGVASYLPFDATPIVQQGTYNGLGTSADYSWTCVNAAGGTAGQVATFTLGANGEGVWKIRTCQHWFDQTNQVEMRVSLTGTGTGGNTIDIIDQKSTELTGDKIFYGELTKRINGGDNIQVEVEFTGGGVTPFPSDAGNRPIEITFEKIV